MTGQGNCLERRYLGEAGKRVPSLGVISTQMITAHYDSMVLTTKTYVLTLFTTTQAVAAVQDEFVDCLAIEKQRGDFVSFDGTLTSSVSLRHPRR